VKSNSTSYENPRCAVSSNNLLGSDFQLVFLKALRMVNHIFCLGFFLRPFFNHTDYTESNRRIVVNDELGRRTVMSPVFARNAGENPLQPVSESNVAPIIRVLIATPRCLL
jgi:hypothetical protein